MMEMKSDPSKSKEPLPKKRVGFQDGSEEDSDDDSKSLEVYSFSQLCLRSAHALHLCHWYHRNATKATDASHCR